MVLGELTVEEALKRNTFQHAKVLTGVNGLNRIIKWCHILEVKEIDLFINGGELILTTGISLLDSANQWNYIETLIKKHAAGLCIELGSSIRAIPSDILSLAEKNNFPIIIFEKTIRFIDITQDLHSLLINRHHQNMLDLDRLSQNFNKLSLQPNGILKILQELSLYFHCPCFFIASNEKYYYPTNQGETEAIIREYIHNHLKETKALTPFYLNNKSYSLNTVQVFDQIWGYLLIENKQFPSPELTALILDRASIALSHILLRNRTTEERKQSDEAELVHSLLNMETLESNQLKNILPMHFFSHSFRLICWPLLEEEQGVSRKGEEFRLYLLMLLRPFFKELGFHPLISYRHQELIVILFMQPPKIELVNLQQITDKLIELTEAYFPSPAFFGISSIHHEPMNAKIAYEEAKQIVLLKQKGLIDCHTYEQIGIYHLVLPLSKTSIIKDYISIHLGKVMEYDRLNNSELLKTLAIYLECNGNKKETSERLFIVRQTLYHRIEKLERILGSNFMHSSNRLAIEVAIKAFYLDERAMHFKDQLLADVK
ncbi:PucR family transcriptional regulator ligand-binding domain-containing protein [Niallia sp.]|uniref:PucR family transcriptional regulator n=1 Tax=Niallia sp. TaxID=2837523 RepID=UPI002896CB21|nr:PucR family transcriptional regulator ligand-binding domain-containing protein [Niallia sp.]